MTPGTDCSFLRKTLPPRSEGDQKNLHREAPSLPRRTAGGRRSRSMYTASQTIDAAARALAAAVEHGRGDHGRTDVLVTEQLLDEADAVARLEGVGREGVAQGAAAGVLDDAGAAAGRPVAGAGRTGRPGTCARGPPAARRGPSRRRGRAGEWLSPRLSSRSRARRRGRSIRQRPAPYMSEAISHRSQPSSLRTAFTSSRVMTTGKRLGVRARTRPVSSPTSRGR